MKNQVLTLLLHGLLLTACSPRVITKIKQELPARSADSVMVFLHGDPLPEECDTVGSIRVSDTGFTSTSRCQYPQVLTLATTKTAECGGNALCIDTHTEPQPLGSTCHQIRGTMLLLPSPFVSASTAMAVQWAEVRRDEELANQVLQDLSRGYTPQNIVKVSIGPSLIYSKLYISNQEYKSKEAFDVQLEYEHIWPKGSGIGISYYGCQTSYYDGNFRVHYFGPSYVYAYRDVRRKFGLGLSLGFGPAFYKDEFSQYKNGYRKGYGIGFMYKVYAEYILGKHFGLGAELGLLSTFFSKPADVKMPKDERYGVQRVNFLVGPRFYF